MIAQVGGEGMPFWNRPFHVKVGFDSTEGEWLLARLVALATRTGFAGPFLSARLTRKRSPDLKFRKIYGVLCLVIAHPAILETVAIENDTVFRNHLFDN